MKPLIDDAIRQALRPEAAPADLREGLLAEARRLDRVRGIRRTLLFQLGLAAALVLALGGGATWLMGRTPAGSATLAQAALSDFMGAHNLDFHGTPPHLPGREPCACWSQKCLGFEATLPQSCSLRDVSGGRACKVKGQDVACYLLSDGRGLFVFPQPIEGADPELTDRPLAVAANYQARVWNEGGRGYVLVQPR